jgi:molybdopterin molybdotransferase
MIAPEAAWQRLVPFLAPLPPERVARRAAAGRVLAEPLPATVDVPFADVSAMDGYAVRGGVADEARLPVAGTVAAGDPPGRALPEGSALRIMTGAPLPLGADRVVPVEDTAGWSDPVTIHRCPEAGAHVRRRGEVLHRGAALLAAGERLLPGALSLLAAHGHEEVLVHRSPRVALLVTGDELVPPGAEPGPGQLRDSHTDFLLAAAARAGASLDPLGICGDEPGALRSAMAAALAHDVLLITGGVSRGAFDFVEGVLDDLGFRPLFDQVAIQPGKPLVAMTPASPPGPLVFGLPGNPASVMVCFWLLVRPALRRLQGRPDGCWHGAVTAVASAPLPAAGARDRFLPAQLSWHDGAARAAPSSPRGSHDLAAFARATALIRIPAGTPPAPAGSPCSALPL